MNLAVAALLAVNLTAGSVRDQHGLPVAGARVLVRNGSTVSGTGTTAVDGTFLVDATGSDVEIRCSYCRPVHVRPDEQGIVTAIVTRYDAPFAVAPVATDLAYLPVATAADLLALSPFVVVNETTRTIPGTSATDRNATAYGGLLVIDGVPAYDPTSGTTTFDSLPQGSLSQLDVLRVDRAYLYGNLAQGGTFVVNTAAGRSDAGAGSNDILRAGVDTDHLDGSVSYANASAGLRAQRGSARIPLQTPGTTGTIDLSSGSGYDGPTGVSALDSSFSSAVIELRTRGSVDAFARAYLDRGTSGYHSVRFPDSSAWSDSGIEAGIDSHATLAPFLHVDARTTAGSYESTATGSDPVSGYLSQTRVSGGFVYRTDALDAFAAAGVGSVTYAGIVPRSDTRPTHDGVVSATVHVSDAWSLHASTSSGYTLQTYVGIYAPPQLPNSYASPVLPGNTNEATIEYGDRSRVRISATALAWNSPAAATSSAGAGVAWQIAPNIAVRTWLLHETSTAWAPGMVGSAWLTFANADRFRADVMWERTLLDRMPRGRLNATFGGRLSDRLDWYAASANILRVQQTSVGIRIR